MIDVFTRLFSQTGPEPSVPVSDWDDERKRELGEETQRRCVACNTPSFRRPLYVTPSPAVGDERIVTVCESCLSAVDRAEEATEERRLPAPIFGQRGYLIDVDGTETQRFHSHGEQETMVIEGGAPDDPDDTDDAYMGEFPRQLIEHKRKEPRGKLYLGHGTKAGSVRTAGAPFDSLFRHVFINGVPGMGKSVLAKNIAMQKIHAGYGICVVDPHNDLVDDLLQTIPSHRRDDVVVIEPSPEAANRVVGLNLLEVEPEPDDSRYDQAVDEAIDIIVSVLRGGKSWGTRMGPICENLCRGMILSETQYTFVDFRSILLDAERRQEFAAELKEEGHEFVANYTSKIAEMDQDELGSLVRRVNRWVESRLTREIVAHKRSSVSFEDLVTDDAIILVKNKVGNDDIEQMIATGLLRRLWRVVEHRPKEDRSPYFFLMDEAHEALSSEMDMDTMLTGARKYQFGLILMSQYLEKIDDPDIKEAIREVCNTFITFRAQGAAADRLGSHYGISGDTIRRLPKYHALTTLEIDGRPQGPFEIRTFAPYPPLRTPEEAREWIVKPSLDEYGVPRLTDEKIRYQTGGETTVGVDETIGQDEDALELTDERQQAVCQAILDEACIQDNDNGAVTVENSRDRIRMYYDDPDALEHDSQVDALLDKMPTGEEDGHIERWEDETGDIWLRTTDNGKSSIFYTGSSPTSGGLKHRELLKNLYEPLTKLGGRVTLPEQPGKKMPDGWLSLTETELADVDPTLDAASHEAVLESFVEKHPVLSRVALGRETVTEPAQATGEDFPTEIITGRGVAIEAERSTGDSNPFQTCLNVVQVTNAGQRCLLCCRPDTAEKIWETLTDPPFYSQYSDDESAEQRLYNGNDLSIGGEQILRPADAKQTVWTHDTETGEYICGDSNGNVYHRFESADAVFEEADAYPATLPKTADVPPHLTGIKVPFIIEWMFTSGEIPDRDQWDILEVPADASDPGDLSLYVEGESVPLGEWEEWLQTQQQTSRDDVLSALKERQSTDDDDAA